MDSEDEFYRLAKLRAMDGLSRIYTCEGVRTEGQARVLELRLKHENERKYRWRRENPDRVRAIQKKYDDKRRNNETPEQRRARLEYQRQYRLKQKELKREQTPKNLEHLGADAEEVAEGRAELCGLRQEDPKRELPDNRRDDDSRLQECRATGTS